MLGTLVTPPSPSPPIDSMMVPRSAASRRRSTSTGLVVRKSTVPAGSLMMKARTPNNGPADALMRDTSSRKGIGGDARS